MKTCSLNCVYCELGRTTELTDQPVHHVDIVNIVEQVRERITSVERVETLTLCGSGEPTLYGELGSLICVLKEEFSLPVAVITNGTLLHLEDVRDALLGADIVMPSLDSAREESFRRINRPLARLSLPDIISGLKTFSQLFTGQLWVEVFLLEGLNDSEADLQALKTVLDDLRADRIQLNTLARPGAEKNIQPVSRERLETIAKFLGKRAEVIVSDILEQNTLSQEAIFSAAQRRPLTWKDIVEMAGDVSRADSAITNGLASKKLSTYIKDGEEFYEAMGLS